MQEKQNLLLFNVYVGWKQRKDKQMMFSLLGKQEKKKRWGRPSGKASPDLMAQSLSDFC